MGRTTLAIFFQGNILEKNSFAKERGATLIRLIVFLLVFTTCISILFYSLNTQDVFARIRDNQRKADLLAIKNSLTVYYKSNGRYPSNPKNGDYRILGSDATAIAWGEQWLPYMNIVPKDSQYSDRSYLYVSPDPYGQTYYIYASLERGGKDPQVCKTSCRHVPVDTLCGTKICNFGLASDNTTP